MKADRTSLREALNIHSPVIEGGTMLKDAVKRTKCRNGFFIPQVGDEVYYFFQGHEEFMAKESCHFYEGRSGKQRETYFYPHVKVPGFAQSESILCKVIHTCLVFDSQEAASLLQGYYDCKEGNVPAIQVRLELLVTQVCGGEPVSHDFQKHPVNLSVRYFHSDRANMGFIVLRQDYEAARQRVAQLKNENRFLDVLKNIRTANPEQPERVRIVGESAYETCYPASHWLSLEVIETKEFEKQRRAANQGRDLILGTQRVNFWQLDLEGHEALIEPAFDEELTRKLVQRMDDFKAKRREAFSVYEDRVPLADYHCFVEWDMHFSLIRERLSVQWYRDLAELSKDLNLIVINSEHYNGPEHVVTADARELTEQLEGELARLADPWAG